MANKHGDFIWYELMTTDANAAQAFYGGLVGWTFADSGHPGMDYRLFTADGPPVGGMMELTKEMQKGGARPLWAGYIAVDDVDATTRKIADAGGGSLMPPQDIPDVGRIAFVNDPQGAPFYIMRASSDQASESFASHEPRNGHCAWNELMTGDPAAAKRFYSGIFGWEVADAMDMGPMGKYEMMKNGAERDFMFGAMMKKPEEFPATLWGFYFRVQNIDDAVRYTNENDGQVINGPMEIPGGEYVFTGIDPQGGMFSLIGNR